MDSIELQPSPELISLLDDILSGDLEKSRMAQTKLAEALSVPLRDPRYLKEDMEKIFPKENIDVSD